MFVLDTDTLTHLLRGQERVSTRRSQVTDDVVLTVITRIEVLQGRFAALLKAANPEQLEEAQRRLTESERHLQCSISCRSMPRPRPRWNGCRIPKGCGVLAGPTCSSLLSPWRTEQRWSPV